MQTLHPHTGDIVESYSVYRDSSNSIRHGPYTAYFPEGTSRETGRFDHGLKDGEWIVFYPDDRVCKRGYYARGQEQGLWVACRTDGQLRWRRHYAAGRDTASGSIATPMVRCTKPSAIAMVNSTA